MIIDQPDVVLRPTSPRLWVVRRGDYPAGTIEHGRRYTALDTEGDVIARCATLHGARAALAAGRTCRADCRHRPGWVARVGGLAVALAAPVVVLAGTLSLALPR